jgi:hypothetical protein
MEGIILVDFGIEGTVLAGFGIEDIDMNMRRGMFQSIVQATRVDNLTIIPATR